MIYFKGFGEIANRSCNEAISFAQGAGASLHRHRASAGRHPAGGDQQGGRCPRRAGAQPWNLPRSGHRTDRKRDPTHLSPRDLSLHALDVLEKATLKTRWLGEANLRAEHLLTVLFSCEHYTAARFARALGVDLRAVCQSCELSFLPEPMPGFGPKAFASGTGRGSGKGLERYGRDLTRLAAEGRLDPCLGREEETERLLEILCRRRKNNPCLIGDAGVGKTAIVEGLAQKNRLRRRSERTGAPRLISLDLTSLIAGTKYGEISRNASREFSRRSPGRKLYSLY